MSGSRPSQSASNSLYRNNGDGTFAEVTATAGVREDPEYSKSLGGIWFDNDPDRTCSTLYGAAPPGADPAAGPHGHARTCVYARISSTTRP